MPLLLALALALAHAKAPDPVAVAASLGEGALASDRAYERLVELSDDIGPRLAGSPGHDKAVAWAVAAMTEDGLANVHTEPVTVNAWVRGEERARLLAPVEGPLAMIGLGNSVGTPEGGVEGDVVVVSNWDQLDALGEAVRGKIVLYDVPFTDYGEVAEYRWSGPSRAAQYGAVATLIRSVGPVGTAALHTGTLWYDEALPKVPGAALTAEDAMRLHRFLDRGLPVRVHLEMGAHFVGDTPSANVVGEVPGRKKNEFVVLGCHLDSWDVGRGAQDDGAGCVEVMEAARLLATLKPAPARTVRVVLYTNEENGQAGATAYAADHAAEIPRHVAAIESDIGAGPVTGFSIDTGERPDAATGLAALAPVVPLLEPYAAATLVVGYGGTDIAPLIAGGVPGFGVEHDTTGYWPVHHTAADTVDKVDPAVLKRNVAAIAVFAWWLAEHPRVVDSPSAETPREGR